MSVDLLIDVNTPSLVLRGCLSVVRERRGRRSCLWGVGGGGGGNRAGAAQRGRGGGGRGGEEFLQHGGYNKEQLVSRPSHPLASQGSGWRENFLISKLDI